MVESISFADIAHFPASLVNIHLAHKNRVILHELDLRWHFKAFSLTEYLLLELCCLDILLFCYILTPFRKLFLTLSELLRVVRRELFEGFGCCYPLVSTRSHFHLCSKNIRSDIVKNTCTLDDYLITKGIW
jgi:hypothetical protein